jgi:uncharacterized protein
MSVPFRAMAETFGLALAGGALCAWLGLPAGWLSGALLGVALGLAAGRTLHVPQRLASIVYIVLGISMGGAVTPETLRTVATWPASIACLLVAMVAVTAATSAWLCLAHGWARRDALLAAVPGALSQVMVMALETKADVRAIAVVQTLRVMILTAFLPGVLAAFGLAPTGSSLPAVAAFDAARPGELALLVVASIAGALVARRLRVPGGLLIGALLASAILHGSGLVTVGLPAPVLLASFVALGAMMGLRFAGTDGATLRRLGLSALGAFLVSVIVAGLFALALAYGLDLAPAGVIVAFAPGALEVMMILAFALHLDVAYVGAHHVVRFLSISLVLPLLLRRAPRSSAEPLKPLDG